MGRRVDASLYAILGALFVLPLWLVPHPPPMDVPGHMAMAAVIGTHGTVGDPFAEFFTVPSWPSPNTLYYYAVGWLGRVVSPMAVNRTILSLILLATPPAIAFARSANGQGSRLWLAGFALAASFNFIAGFVGFSLALTFMIALAGLARRQMLAPSWKRGGLLALTAVAVYLSHAFVFVFSIGVVGLVALCAMPSVERPWRRFAATVGPTLTAVALAVPWYLSRMSIMAKAGGANPRFSSVSEDLQSLPKHSFDVLMNSWDMIFGWTMVVGLVAVAVVSAAKSPCKACGWRQRLGSRAYLLAAVVAVALYFALPSSMRHWEVIYGRMAVIAFVLLAMWVPVTDGRLVKGLILATVASSALYGAVLWSATFALAKETGDIHALIQKAEPHTKLIAPHARTSKVFRMGVHRHLGSYHAVWNHGFVANSFAKIPVQPVRVTPRWFMPHFSRRNIRHYDYVLSGKELPWPQLSVVGRAGWYVLYRVSQRSDSPRGSHKSSSGPLTTHH